MTFEDESLLLQFEEAVAGLWWMSETDAPFEVFFWQQAFPSGFSIPELIQITDHDDALPVEIQTVDQFFEPALKSQDWHGEDELDDLRRLKRLKALIQECLHEHRVCRIGDTFLDIYIVGKTASQAWIALSTQAVET